MTFLYNFFSETTLNLARHLSPAFIRFHGPSIPSFIFSNEFTDTEERLTVTPDMWTSLNEWIAKANLTGIFALSDRERVNEAWNAKTVLPLMELTDKMNLNCYWELGNGKIRFNVFNCGIFNIVDVSCLIYRFVFKFVLQKIRDIY